MIYVLASDNDSKHHSFGDGTGLTVRQNILFCVLKMPVQNLFEYS
jgi:hypothetical protein